MRMRQNRSTGEVVSLPCDHDHKTGYLCSAVSLRTLIVTSNILIREIEHPLSQASNITFLVLFFL